MNPQPCIDALHRSHDRLTAIVGDLTSEEYASPSYDDDWSVAQVLSHLGSQWEIFPLMLDAGLHGAEAPGVVEFQPIWDTWNAKSPVAQVADYATATNAALRRLDELPDESRERFSIAMFGMTLDLATMLQMRVNEQVLHTWDVEVMRDPAAEVEGATAALVLDLVLQLAQRLGRPQPDATPVALNVVDLAQRYEVELDPSIRFVAAEQPGDSSRSASLNAASLLRLIAGRLDEAHLPSTVALQGVTLDELHAVFPGY